MLRTKLLWSACLLTLFPLSLSAADGVSLAWQFRKGEQFYTDWHLFLLMESRQGTSLSANVEENRIVSRFRVLEVDKSSVVLELQIGHLQLRSQTGGPSAAHPLKGSPLTITLDRDFKLTKIEGLELLAGFSPGDTPTPQQKATLQGYENLLRGWLERVLHPMPERAAVRKGESWSRDGVLIGPVGVTLKQHYTYQGPTARGSAEKVLLSGSHSVDQKELDKANIKDMKIIGEGVRGTLLIDPQQGRMVQAEVQVDLEIKGTRQPFPGAKPVSIQALNRCVHTLRVTKENPLEQPEPPAIVLASFEKPAEQPRALPKETINSVGMKLVRVPAGKFTMGAKEFGRETEAVVAVEITRPFLMGAHEVTIGQFKQFVQETGYQTDAERTPRGCFGFDKSAGKLVASPSYSWKNPGWDHDDRHPTVNLSWLDAQAYCAWLSKKEGKSYRLPREAEWEYACRAGSTTAYSSGDEPESLAKCSNVVDASCKKVFPQWQAHRGDDGFAFTSPVGSFPPNAFGLCDMHGNALEWCEDWYFAYPSGPLRDPQGPPLGLTRVQRGGGFSDFPHHCTSARRTTQSEETCCVSSGFRVVLSDEPVRTVAKPKPSEATWVGQTVLWREPSGSYLDGFTKNSPRPLSLSNLAPKVTQERLGLLRLWVGGREAVVARDDVVLLAEAEKLYSELLEKEPTVPLYVLKAAACRAAGKGKDALAALDEVIGFEEDNPWLRLARANLQGELKDYRKALADMRKAVELKGDSPWTHNSLAWFLATCPDEQVRSGAKAIEAAKKAAELAQPGDSFLLDTLAAAHAEAGDFDEAVRCEEKALSNPLYAQYAGDAPRKRLELYRQKKPYREVAELPAKP